MAGDSVHYLFGELARFNATRIWPADQTELKAWLDDWLPQSVQAADEAEPDFAEARRLCDAWQRDDWKDEVGVISLPLAGTRCAGAKPYAHLICRVYFNWASAGRVSRTGHAALLTEDAWRGLDYNPFAMPHMVENAAPFSAPESLQFPEPIALEDAQARLQRLHERFQHEGAEWQASLRQIWAGQLPVCIERNAPQWLYELLLLSIPREQRRGISCISGPFGVKRRLSGAVHIRRRGDDEQPVAETAAGRPDADCLSALADGKGIEGCWKVVVPAGRAHALLALATGDDGAESASLAVEPPVDSTKPSRRRLVRAIGIGLVGVAVVGLVAWLGAAWLSGKRAQAQVTALVADCADGATRRAGTIPLLIRADDLLTLDLSTEDRDKLGECVDKLLGLLQARRDVVDGPPLVGEEDIRRVHELIGQLSALARLPRVGHGNDRTIPDTDTTTLYRRCADWVRAVPTAAEQRARLDFVQADAAASGLVPNPYLREVAANLRALEQEEALRDLKAFVFASGPVDDARLAQARERLDAFRGAFPDAPRTELAEIASEIVARFEAGIRPPLLRAYLGLRQHPTKQALTALEQAVADYETALQAIKGLVPPTGIDTSALIARIRDGRIVEVRAVSASPGYRIDHIGLLVAPDQCRAQRRFSLFNNDMICVRLIELPPLPTPGAQPTLQQRLLGPALDMLAGSGSGADERIVKDYQVRMQTLLVQPVWRSRDGLLSLQTEVQWPEPDEFLR